VKKLPKNLIASARPSAGRVALSMEMLRAEENREKKGEVSLA